MFLSSVCSNAVGLFLLLRFFLRGSADDIRRIITMVISEYTVLADVKSILYATDGVGSYYLLGSLRPDYVGSGMLFRLETPSVNIFSHSGLHKVAGRMKMDLVIFTSELHRVTVIS